MHDAHLFDVRGGRLAGPSLAGPLLAALLACAAFASPAAAALGDCGQPVSNGAKPSAGDALAILKEAVGQNTPCDAKPCICDLTGTSAISAADALVALKIAVGQNLTLACGSCTTVTTTSSTSSSTSSTSSTSTSMPTALTFTTIQSVFSTSCAGSGCHDGANNSGNLGNIDDKAKAYAELTTENVSCSPTSLAGKTRVVPGDADQSFLLKKLSGTHDCGLAMPAVGPSLSPAFLEGLRLWIESGAPLD